MKGFEDQSMESHQIDLWYVFLDKADDPLLKTEYRSLLSPDELRREQRFIPPQARHQCVVSRALLRTTLAHYANTDPRRWEFQFSPHGKPSIRFPAGLPWQFNLSHTRGLAVCAVSHSHAVGVDAELPNDALDYMGLARRFFHAAESAALEDLPDDRRRELFLQFWTLKEAYLKACGKGFSIPLSSFGFSLEPGQPPRIFWTIPSRQPTDGWHFAQVQLSTRYEIAMATCLPIGQSLQVRVRETLPLRWQRPWQALPDQDSHRWILA